jgi:hypothetical protein
MTHWLDKLWVIPKVQTSNLRELAIILDADPRSFYRDQDLQGCDLRGQDLREMDFTNSNLSKAVLDSATKLSPVFDPRVSTLSDYIGVVLTRDLNSLITRYAEEAKYRYPAWAFKALIERGIHIYAKREWDFYTALISGNEYLSALLDSTSKYSLLEKRMQIYDWQQRRISIDMGLGLLEHRFAITMLVGLVSRKISFADNKDYSQIRPNSLIKVTNKFEVPDIGEKFV